MQQIGKETEKENNCEKITDRMPSDKPRLECDCIDRPAFDSLRNKCDCIDESIFDGGGEANTIVFGLNKPPL